MQYNTTEWYNSINELNTKNGFEELHKAWFSIFECYCKLWHFNDAAIKVLFYNFQMDNWKAMHKENTEYKDYSDDELLNSFIKDVEYSSDRMSFDRLFRNHWKFRQLFRTELLFFCVTLKFKIDATID